MKLSIRLVLILLLPLTITAQDSIVMISQDMFDGKSDQLFMSAMKGWIFKQGSDTAWAKKNLDPAGWKKLKPTDLSATYADKTGRVEGWFRIKIKMDTSFGDKAFSIKGSTWAASDFYIDGKLVASQGNTGINGMPYHEHNPYGNLATAIDLKAGKEYTIAVHFVDYTPSLLSFQLKSQFTGLSSLIRITGPGYNKYFLLKGVKELVTFYIVWISVCAILSLLFWFLYLQNPFEKNLLVIALCSTLITLAEYCQFSSGTNTTMSFTGFAVYNFLFVVFVAAICVLITLLLARIFKGRLSRGLKIYLIVFSAGMIITYQLPDNIANPLTIGLLASIVVVGAYYIFTSWRKLKGAQWAIVAGTLSTLIWAIAYIFVVTLRVQNDSLNYMLATGYSLSFPLSLLVYVALRFKEAFTEVKMHAQQVIHLSEEKKQQALNQQKKLEDEVSRQTLELRNTLNDLKSTQAQLIQSEKMASLGELTAGIAHEIQNPLNFVNNFSDVNTELVDELRSELAVGNLQSADEIATSIKDNEQKINHHGKRADAIVKGMLQHSRTSGGKKELTDINALIDEYIRLAYHGFRAKDPRDAAHKSFSAKVETGFDESIGNINTVPQDMGRALLNLINNAFYAVNEKAKQNIPGYEPAISVGTKKTGNTVYIKISDNGGGIPQKIADKIFQPFFTTKPTGQGTGLGLSLAYDIVKAHGGEINVNSKDGQGSEFIIAIPA